MKVLRGARCTAALIGSMMLLFAACGGGGAPTPDALIDADADADAGADADAVTLWVAEEAVSLAGTAYGLSLTAQPLPTSSPAADAGYVSFGLDPAPLNIVNKVIDRPTPGFEVDTYLFFDCDLLSSEPVSRTEGDRLVISAAAWESEPDRLIAADGGHCVQRLDPVSIEGGLAPGAAVTVDVGIDDLGFVVPEEQQGRIETMLGRPLFAQFGITETTGARFFSARVDLGAKATATPGAPAPDPDGSTSGRDAHDGATMMEPAEVLALVGAEAFAELMGDGSLREVLRAGDDELVTSASEVDVASAPSASTECPTNLTPPRRVFDGAPPSCIDAAAAYTATVATTVGEFTIELDAAAAPAAVNNFVVLARYGFYDDTPCHRIIADFIAQCGDPTGTGLGGPGYSFADELPEPGRYEVGSVAMANSGPDTNGSQWFIVTGEQGTTLPPSYSLFGRVTDGLDDAVVWMNGLGSADGTPLDEVRIESVTIHTT